MLHLKFSAQENPTNKHSNSYYKIKNPLDVVEFYNCAKSTHLYCPLEKNAYLYSFLITATLTTDLKASVKERIETRDKEWSGCQMSVSALPPGCFVTLGMLLKLLTSMHLYAKGNNGFSFTERFYNFFGIDPDP